jgi:hypothetical protein
MDAVALRLPRHGNGRRSGDREKEPVTSGTTPPDRTRPLLYTRLWKRQGRAGHTSRRNFLVEPMTPAAVPSALTFLCAAAALPSWQHVLTWASPCRACLALLFACIDALFAYLLTSALCPQRRACMRVGRPSTPSDFWQQATGVPGAGDTPGEGGWGWGGSPGTPLAHKLPF